jgi:hypothetical protein
MACQQKNGSGRRFFLIWLYLYRLLYELASIRYELWPTIYSEVAAMARLMTDEQQKQMIFECGRVFSPSAPIDNMALFAGRISQIRLASEAVTTRGGHAIIFGERGVGKTSLANIIKSLLAMQKILTVKVNCAHGDTFESIWRKVFSEITLTEERNLIGFAQQTNQVATSLVDMVQPPLEPGTIKRVLNQLSQNQECVIILDEFDRLKAKQYSFADTVKDLSDSSTRVTLVFVGVADDVDELIKEHASIDRCLAQIKMPRMASQELREILDKASGTLHMIFDPHVETLILLLSNGLPHYTHLLGYESAVVAIENRNVNVEMGHLDRGIERALVRQQEAIGALYRKATDSPRKDTLFKEVLLACALAEVDTAGFFRSADVREPLYEITGKNYEIPGFSQHLDKFSGSDSTRGPVLEKSGTARRFRFRFINPLLQPYVIMKGIAEKLISQDLLITLMTKTRTQPPPDMLF